MKMRYAIRFFSNAAICAIVNISVPAFAQKANTTAQSPEADDFHNSDEIVVTATFGKQLDILAGTSAISGEKLATDSRGQIGDTLTQLPGVSATSFSPGASRPVLRGFQGGRVAVLTDGIGNIDASNTSADHAVTIEALTAERIEVLRGPAVLLYGGQAVGGAVNIIDKRIPRRIPDEPIHIDAIAGYASANQEYSGGISVDAPVAERFVIHADGSYRNGKDLRSGGSVVAPVLRAQTVALADSTVDPAEATSLRAQANALGKVPGTFVKTWTAGLGAAFIGNAGNIGASFNIFDTAYGIASRPGGEQGLSIKLKQYRYDLRGEVEIGGGFIKKIKIRTGYANYRHTEITDDGEVGTLFLSKGIETRAELVQNDRSGWNGASGIQFQTRDFKAIGEEAFVPPNLTSQLGLFTLQDFTFGKLGVQVSLRYDQSNLREKLNNQRRSFGNISAAVGLSYSDGPLKIGSNISRTGRAPSAEELFSNGPHFATQAFEIGDVNLKKNAAGMARFMRVTTVCRSSLAPPYMPTVLTTSFLNGRPY